jgi:hypothetical protein
MDGTTSISSLPNDNKGNNIVLEKISKTDGVLKPTASILNDNALQGNEILKQGLTSDDIKQIVNGIKEAGALNLTSLPSRDIPMTTTNLTNDSQINPNFVPKNDKYDYINNDETLNNVMETRHARRKKAENIDYIYNEINISLFIMVLFFLFNLPIMNNILMGLIPKMFRNDGSIKLPGLLLKTGLFGSLYYLSFKVTNYLTNI